MIIALALAASAPAALDIEAIAARGRAQRDWMQCIDEKVDRYKVLVEEDAKVLLDVVFTACSRAEQTWRVAAIKSATETEDMAKFVAEVHAAVRANAMLALIDYRVPERDCVDPDDPREAGVARPESDYCG